MRSRPKRWIRSGRSSDRHQRSTDLRSYAGLMTCLPEARRQARCYDFSDSLMFVLYSAACLQDPEHQSYTCSNLRESLLVLFFSHQIENLVFDRTIDSADERNRQLHAATEAESSSCDGRSACLRVRHLIQERVDAEPVIFWKRETSKSSATKKYSSCFGSLSAVTASLFIRMLADGIPADFLRMIFVLSSIVFLLQQRQRRKS